MGAVLSQIQPSEPAPESTLQESSKLFNREDIFLPMQHRMAVRANGPQVVLGIQHICLTDCVEGLEVVDVNEAFAEVPVHRMEVKVADDADAPHLLMHLGFAVGSRS